MWQFLQVRITNKISAVPKPFSTLYGVMCLCEIAQRWKTMAAMLLLSHSNSHQGCIPNGAISSLLRQCVLRTIHPLLLQRVGRHILGRRMPCSSAEAYSHHPMSACSVEALCLVPFCEKLFERVEMRRTGEWPNSVSPSLSPGECHLFLP